MPFAYTHEVTSKYEKAVMSAGYPWVQTNPLNPYTGMPFDESNIDRLNEHEHHGPNTHLIVKGDLQIRKARPGFGRPLRISTDHNVPKEAVAEAGQMYRGHSVGGCQFVEGHQCLSPSTANRYMARGTIKWVSERSRCRPGKEKIRKWLREATLWPGGYVRFAEETKPQEEQDLQDEIGRWFAREWVKKPGPSLVNVTGLYKKREMTSEDEPNVAKKPRTS